MKEVLRFALVLGIVGASAAALLGGVYRVTKPRKDRWEKKVLEDSLQEVLASVDAVVFKRVPEEGELLHYQGFSDDDAQEPAGYAFVAGGKGYSSTIQTLVGIRPDCTITSIKVLSQQETPGLGARAEEVPPKWTLWEKVAAALRGTDEETGGEEEPDRPWFQVQFDDRSTGELRLGSDPAESIQGIGGATITSKAIVSSVRQEMEAACERLGLPAKGGEDEG